jgi:hypothetical protein
MRSTRRAFVADIARRTTYIAPAVLALQATQRASADWTGCVGPGSACTGAAGECCATLACLKPNQTECMVGNPGCTCQ